MQAVNPLVCVCVLILQPVFNDKIQQFVFKYNNIFTSLMTNSKCFCQLLLELWYEKENWWLTAGD